MNDIRKIIIQSLVLIVTLIYAIKLFFIQVLDDRYVDMANSNVILREIDYPVRGLIYDRNGKLLVYNTPEYELLVVNRELANFDSARFASIFGLSALDLRKKFKAMKERKEYSPDKPTLLLEKLSHEDFAHTQDRIDEFEGFYVQHRTTRAYTYQGIANVLGYVSEISKKQLAEDTLSFYKQGDYIGQSGIESFYEDHLRGKKGVHFILRNVRGLKKGAYKDGAYDTLAIPGQDLTCTIDADLQQYGERLMRDKIGSIVIIEPNSGEILTMVSSPSYDPSLLTGKEHGVNFARISADTSKPFFNRPLMAQYRPGSIFKIAQALTALQNEVIQPDTHIYCRRSIINCHGNHRNEALRGAIAKSCNPYFYETFRRMIDLGASEDPYEQAHLGLNNWSEYIRSFGFGRTLGIDLPGEKTGLIPTSAYYDKAYDNRPWKFSNIFSLAIGEGENLVVPIQMANFVAIIANRGYYYVPHLVKQIGTSGTPKYYTEKHYTMIDTAYFKVAVDAMYQVVEQGTGQYRAKLADVVVCGKTGTVQNIPPRPDHSVFIAFAPKDNPQLAISVYVENAGQGARAAASIASLMIEKYLYGKTKRPYIEQYVLQGQFLH